MLMCMSSVCVIILDQCRSPPSAGSLQYRSSVPYIIPAVSSNPVTVYCSPDGCIIPSAQPQVAVFEHHSLLYHRISLARHFKGLTISLRKRTKNVIVYLDG